MSVANNNILFISSVVSFFSAYSHIFCNKSSLPHFTAQCQAVIPELSVANKNIKLSTLLLVF
jgi:hypothetical protein